MSALHRVNGFSDTVIATSNDSSDDILCNVFKEFNLNYYRGSLNNLSERYLLGIKDMIDSDTIIRLTADNPLPDKYLLDELV